MVTKKSVFSQLSEWMNENSEKNTVPPQLIMLLKRVKSFRLGIIFILHIKIWIKIGPVMKSLIIIFWIMARKYDLTKKSWIHFYKNNYRYIIDQDE